MGTKLEDQGWVDHWKKAQNTMDDRQRDYNQFFSNSTIERVWENPTDGFCRADYEEYVQEQSYYDQYRSDSSSKRNYNKNNYSKQYYNNNFEGEHWISLSDSDISDDDSSVSGDCSETNDSHDETDSNKDVIIDFED